MIYPLVLSEVISVLKTVEEQIERVRQVYPNIEVRKQSDGSIHLEISDFKVPDGWSPDRIRIMVVIPTGYPTNRPNGFEADINLRLQDGNKMPTQGCGQHQINGQPWVHFCWQPKVWDHTRETLHRYIKFIERRFVEIVG